MINFIKQRWVDIVLFIFVALATALFAGKKDFLGSNMNRILIFIGIGVLFVLLGKTSSGQRSAESGYLTGQHWGNWRFLPTALFGLLIGYFIRSIW